MWSPQLYKQEGLKLDLPETLLDVSIAHSEEVINSQHNLPSILSLKHLSERTGVGYGELREYVARRDRNSYRKFSIKKRSGGRRFIRVPASPLMFTQKWINEFILKDIPVHPTSHAFKMGNSIRECAAKHCGAKWLIKVDVMDFFESVQKFKSFVYLRNLGINHLLLLNLRVFAPLLHHGEVPGNFTKIGG